jgi:ABC-type uncharacterized transport system YnjBCD substrate-binding protein
MRKGLIALLALFVVGPATPGFGQITPELIDAAKKEGEVVFYGAITVNSSKRIAELFEKKYGIKMKHWRGDATEIVNRAVTEARAGRPTFDVTLGKRSCHAGTRREEYPRSFRPAVS